MVMDVPKTEDRHWRLDLKFRSGGSMSLLLSEAALSGSLVEAWGEIQPGQSVVADLSFIDPDTGKIGWMRLDCADILSATLWSEDG